MQSKAREALTAFAEDVYYCSLEYGPQDARTSLGYYNLAKVLQSTGDMQVPNDGQWTRTLTGEKHL